LTHCAGNGWKRSSGIPEASAGANMRQTRFRCSSAI
jgi:hypothetical protein